VLAFNRNHSDILIMNVSDDKSFLSELNYGKDDLTNLLLIWERKLLFKKLAIRLKLNLKLKLKLF